MKTLKPSQQAATELLARRRARRGLLAFTEYTMPEYRVNWHHRALCDYLDKFAAGEIKRLMVCMPPQHGKSELVSRRLPAFLFGRDPDARIVACSYASDLSQRMNRDVQRIIDSDPYRKLFPETQLSGTNVKFSSRGSYVRTSDLFEVVDHKGSYRSAGVGGGITGMSASYAIIDDPVKNAEDAYSPTVRDKVYEWYTSSLLTRLRKGGGVLLTMTRWHRDDLGGRLLRESIADEADKWTVLRLPAICTGDDNQDDPRQPGEPLWPAHKDLDELHAIRAMGESNWAALYQQDPRPDGGTEWPSTYFDDNIWFDEWPEILRVRVMALDPSKGKRDQYGDYSAYVMVGVGTDGLIYVEGDLQRRPVPQIIADGVSHYRNFKPQVLYVEGNGFQDLVADGLRNELATANIDAHVVDQASTENKRVRIRGLSWLLSRYDKSYPYGRLRFKSRSPGTRLLVEQMQDFPLAEHDDGPDCLEMAVRVVIELLEGTGESVAGMVA